MVFGIKKVCSLEIGPIYIYIFLYKNYIIHCKIKKTITRYLKLLGYPGIKQILRKENKNLQIIQVATTINTEYTDLSLA